MGEPAPELSVVVVVPEGVRGASERWQAVLGSARAVELVLVRAASAADAPSGARSLAAPPGSTVPRLRALGLEAARGTIVAFGEAFLRPVPGWTDAHLAAHRANRAHQDRRVSAVAGSFARATGRAPDWALTFVEYGRFLAAGSPPRRDDASFANVSFDRERLLALLGGAPQELVEPEVLACLRAAGVDFAFCAEACLLDENQVPLGRALVALYHHGRFYGARRVARSSFGTRLLRCALSPLVPPLQLARVARRALAAGAVAPLLRAFAALVLLCCAWAVGEGVGSLVGEGASGRRWR
jgi:hypothetical protein